MNKEKLVPKLRFPEFREAGEWEKTPLSNLGETLNGLSGKSASDFGSGKPYVTYKQVFDRAWIDFDRCEKVNVLENENQNELRQGDILFTTSSETPNEVGYASVILNIPPKPLYLNSFCFAFRPFNLEKLIPQFSQYLFHSPIYRKAIGVLAQGSTRFNISKGAFLNLKIPIPVAKPEQQKIAATLTSLDDLISAQGEKIEALRRHKKGLMQQLFPAEGETVPRLRFAEFEGEWEESTFGQVATFLKGKGISKSDIVPNGSLPCIRYGELYTHYGETISKVISNTNLLKDDLVLSQANDVIIPASGETKEDIATASCVTKSGIALGGDLNIIRTKINGVFLSYYLNNAKKQEIARLAQGISVVHLYPGQLQQLRITIPKEKEQQKIAATLTTLDDLIAAQSEKLEALKAHKRGLMQGMFP